MRYMEKKISLICLISCEHLKYIYKANKAFESPLLACLQHAQHVFPIPRLNWVSKQCQRLTNATEIFLQQIKRSFFEIRSQIEILVVGLEESQPIIHLLIKQHQVANGVLQLLEAQSSCLYWLLLKICLFMSSAS